MWASPLPQSSISFYAPKQSPIPHPPPPPTPHQHSAQQPHSAGVQRMLACGVRHQTICRGHSGCQVPLSPPSTSSRAQHGCPPAGEQDGAKLTVGWMEKTGTSGTKGLRGLVVSRKSEGCSGPEHSPPLDCSRALRSCACPLSASPRRMGPQTPP